MQHLDYSPEQRPKATTYPSLINRIDSYLAPPPNSEHTELDPLARDLFNELDLPTLALSACGQFTEQAGFHEDELWWLGFHTHMTSSEGAHPSDMFTGVSIDLGEKYGSLFLGIFEARSTLRTQSYLTVEHVPPWSEAAYLPDMALLGMRVQTCVLGSVLLHTLSPLQRGLRHNRNPQGMPLDWHSHVTSHFALYTTNVYGQKPITLGEARRAILIRTMLLRRDFDHTCNRRKGGRPAQIITQEAP